MRKVMEGSAASPRLTVGQAAKIVGCGTGWIRYLADVGRLPSERGAMGERLLERRAVENLAQERKRERTGVKR